MGTVKIQTERNSQKGRYVRAIEDSSLVEGAKEDNPVYATKSRIRQIIRCIECVK